MAEVAEKNDKNSKEWAGAFAAFSKAFDTIKQNPQPILLYAGVYALASVLGRSAQYGDTATNINYGGLGGLVSLVFLLALPVYALAVADGKKISLGEFMRFDAFKFFSIFSATLLAAIIIGVSILALVIPAIWTIAWFFAVSLVVADQKLGPIAALKESKRLAQNNKSKVWGIIGVGILLGIVASLFATIPFVGGALTALASVWTIASGAILYRWLQKNV